MWNKKAGDFGRGIWDAAALALKAKFQHAREVGI
jgi:hypothetical protein